jgi:hypothetical protein
VPQFWERLAGSERVEDTMPLRRKGRKPGQRETGRWKELIKGSRDHIESEENIKRRKQQRG